MTYRSTKIFGHNLGLSACFRQWKATSHCNLLHGYALQVGFVFESDTLDDKNWVVNFGGLKEIKAWLEQQFDHKTLVAFDDPDLNEFLALERKGIIALNLVPATGCEAFAEMIFTYVEDWMQGQYGDRVRLVSVEVREHGANSALVTKERVV